METAFVILLNIVYGFFFFLAFGVMIATMILFAMAFWDKVGREVVRRLAGER